MATEKNSDDERTEIKEGFSRRFRNLILKLAKMGYLGENFKGKEQIAAKDVKVGIVRQYFNVPSRNNNWMNISNNDEKGIEYPALEIYIAPKLRQDFPDDRHLLAILYLTGQFAPHETELSWMDTPITRITRPGTRLQPDPHIKLGVKWERSSDADMWCEQGEEDWAAPYKGVAGGVQILERLFHGEKLATLAAQFKLQGRAAPRAVRQALFGNHIRIVHVDRNHDLELQLCDLHWPVADVDGKQVDRTKLRNVRVARVPVAVDGDESEPGYVASSLVRTELVAWCMANELNEIIDKSGGNLERVIGLSRGYTLERVAWLSNPSDVTEVITWVPMHTSKITQKQDADNRNAHIADPRASNGIAKLLASIHPGSELLYLPFVDSEPKSKALIYKGVNPGTPHWHDQYAFEVFKAIREDARLLILSTSGVPSTNEDTMPASDDTRYRFNEIAELIERDILPYQDKRNRFGGMIVGNIIDQNGHYFSKEIRTKVDELRTAVDLELLRDRSKVLPVWMVAGGAHKKVSVLAAIRGGLVNSLCIDEEIAKYLIKHAASK